jgi:hypothetical protein
MTNHHLAHHLTDEKALGVLSVPISDIPSDGYSTHSQSYVIPYQTVSLSLSGR